MLSQIASTERLFVTCKFCGEFWQRRDRLFLGLDLPMTFCCLINCRRQYRRLLCTRSRPDPVELPWIDLGLVIAIAPGGNCHKLVVRQFAKRLVTHARLHVLAGLPPQP